MPERAMVKLRAMVMVIAGVGLVGNFSQCCRRRRGFVWQWRIRAAMAMKAVVMVMVIAMASENLAGKIFSSFFFFFFGSLAF